jgi:hypothetical protein
VPRAKGTISQASQLERRSCVQKKSSWQASTTITVMSAAIAVSPSICTGTGLHLSRP